MNFKFNKQKRASGTTKNGQLAFLLGNDDISTLGYSSLAQNPEIVSGVTKIANLIGSMTIKLMANTEKGDVRVKNQLSRKLDITPNQFMTRSNWMSDIVRTMLLEGNGNAVVYPITKNGYFEDFVKIAPGRVGFIPDGYGYKITIDGKQYDPSNLLHFVVNPDVNYPWKGTGYRVCLKDIANSLKQAQETKSAFMSSKFKPSLVVKVDAQAQTFKTKEGRNKIVKEYLETTEAGEPWIIPSESFSVEQVKPLSLNDLALNDAVVLDKKTVASILDVPAFVLGAGEYNAEEWRGFINTKIMPLAKIIEQEMTRKLLISETMYIKLNAWSLYNYDLETLASVGNDLSVRGTIDRNEVRDWLNMDPREGLDELIILENYIPAGMIGDQKKLNKKGEDDGK